MKGFTNENIKFDVLRQRAYNMRWAEQDADVIPLTAADHDFPCAPEVVQALQDYIKEGYFTYTPHRGFPSFKQAIDAKNGLLNTTVYADTVNLGSMITGTGTKDVVSDYYSWIETYYNWDPETFEIKDVYLGCMITSYLYGYLSSMAYLSTVEGTGTDAEKLNATLAKEDLGKQADQVLKKLVGQRERVWDQDSMTYKEKFQKSPLRQATEPLANKKIRCLINEHVYSLDNHTGPLSGRMYDDAYFENASFGKSVERDDVLMYSFTGELNLAQWQQMEANLPQVRKIKYSQKPLHDYGLDMSDAATSSANCAR